MTADLIILYGNLFSYGFYNYKNFMRAHHVNSKSNYINSIDDGFGNITVPNKQFKTQISNLYPN